MAYPGITSRSSNFISMNSKITSCAASPPYESPLLSSSACPSTFSTYSKPDYCHREDYTRDGTSVRKSRSRSTRSVKNSSHENQCTRGISADRIFDLDKALSSGYSDPLCGISKRDPNIDFICKKTEQRHYNEGDHIGIPKYPSTLCKTNDMKGNSTLLLRGFSKLDEDLEVRTNKEPKQLNECNTTDTKKDPPKTYKTNDPRFKCLRNTKFGTTTTAPEVSDDTGGKKINKCPCCGNDVEEFTCNNRLCSSLITLQGCLHMTRKKRKHKRLHKTPSSLERRQQYNETHKEWMANERRQTQARESMGGRQMNEFGQYAFQERGKDGKMYTVYRDTFKVDEDLLRERKYGAKKEEKPKELKNVHTMTYSGEENTLGVPVHDKQVMTVLNYSNMDLTSGNLQLKGGGGGGGHKKGEPKGKKMAVIATQTMFPPSDQKYKPKTPAKGGRGMAQIKSKIDTAATQTDYEHVCAKCKKKGKNTKTATTQTEWDYPDQTILRILWGKTIGMFGPKPKKTTFHISDKPPGEEGDEEDEEEAKKKKSKQAKYRRKKKEPPKEPEKEEKTEAKDKKSWLERAKMFIEPDDGGNEVKPMFSLDEIMQDVITETPWVEKKQGGTWFQGFGGMGTIEENKTASNIYSQGTEVVPVVQNNVRVLEWANYFSFVWNRPWIRYNINSEINLIPWGLLKNNQTQRQYLLNEGQKENKASVSEEIRAGNHADDLDYFQFPLSFKQKKSELYEANSKLHRKTSSKQLHFD